MFEQRVPYLVCAVELPGHKSAACGFVLLWHKVPFYYIFLLCKSIAVDALFCFFSLQTPVDEGAVVTVLLSVRECGFDSVFEVRLVEAALVAGLREVWVVVGEDMSVFAHEHTAS